MIFCELQMVSKLTTSSIKVTRKNCNQQKLKSVFFIICYIFVSQVILLMKQYLTDTYVGYYVFNKGFFYVCATVLLLDHSHYTVKQSTFVSIFVSFKCYKILVMFVIENWDKGKRKVVTFNGLMHQNEYLIVMMGFNLAIQRHLLQRLGLVNIVEYIWNSQFRKQSAAQLKQKQQLCCFSYYFEQKMNQLTKKYFFYKTSSAPIVNFSHSKKIQSSNNEVQSYQCYTQFSFFLLTGKVIR